MRRYYFDTCIWRDFYENRTDRIRPIGEWAFRLLNSIDQHGGFIYVSDVVLKELRTCYTERQINIVLGTFRELIIIVGADCSTIKAAHTLRTTRGVPVGDALHALLARRNGCILVTRDAHFVALCDFVEIRKPEELL